MENFADFVISVQKTSRQKPSNFYLRISAGNISRKYGVQASKE